MAGVAVQAAILHVSFLAHVLARVLFLGYRDLAGTRHGVTSLEF
jgi:hypothetical protein